LTKKALIYCAFAALVSFVVACGSAETKKEEVFNQEADSARFEKLMEQDRAKQEQEALKQADITPVPTPLPAAAPVKVRTQKTAVRQEKIADERYYPEHIGNTWYFMGYKKNAPDKMLKVKAEILSEEIKDGQPYYYIHAPQIGIRYVNKRKADAVYMRVIKYPFPIFGFPIEVDIVPEMPVIKFPLIAGAKWFHEAKARAVVLFVPLERNIRSDFEIIGRETIKVPAGELDTWRIKVLVNQGDGNVTTEEYWYARDFGYCKANTSGHYAELVGYRFWDEMNKRWNEKIPADEKEYK